MNLYVACPFGGVAPCCDDLCYGGHTLCGLEEGVDFCWHHRYPDNCDQCRAEDADWYGDIEDVTA